MICHICKEEITPDQQVAPCATCGILVHAKCRDSDCPLHLAKEQKQAAGYVCTECGWKGNATNTAIVKIIGGKISTVLCCPKCDTMKSTIHKCCEEPGCAEIATQGTPFKCGYKRHCHKHPPTDGLETNNKQPEKETK